MTRQNVKRFGKKVMRQTFILERGWTQNRVPLLLAALRATLLDKAAFTVQKLCRRIRGLPQHTKAR
jgi:hypothetical protein